MEKSRAHEVYQGTKDTKFKKQSQKKLLTFLKALWIVIPTMWYIFLKAEKCQFIFPYVSSTVTKFRCRFNNYKSTHCKFRKKLEKKKNYLWNLKNWIKTKTVSWKLLFRWVWGLSANWCVTLIYQFEDKKELRKRELYWIN